jgi:hypothetical protein
LTVACLAGCQTTVGRAAPLPIAQQLAQKQPSQLPDAATEETTEKETPQVALVLPLEKSLALVLPIYVELPRYQACAPSTQPTPATTELAPAAAPIQRVAAVTVEPLPAPTPLLPAFPVYVELPQYQQLSPRPTAATPATTGRLVPEAATLPPHAPAPMPSFPDAVESLTPSDDAVPGASVSPLRRAADSLRLRWSQRRQAQ